MSDAAVTVAMHGRDTSGRVYELDALRGIAAALVIWHHFRMALVVGTPRWFVAPFASGHEAVLLFFVLSGYVLSLPTWRGRQPGYAEYLARRIGRIYLPYLGAAVLAAVGCVIFFGSRLPLTPWFYETWQTPLTLKVLARQMLMDTAPVLNTAFWSLRYEMEMSIVFPFLCVAMMRVWRYAGLVVIPVMLGLASVLYHRPGMIGLAQTFHYTGFFIAGAMLSRDQAGVSRFLARLDRRILWVALGMSVSFLLFVSPRQSRFRVAELPAMIAVCVLIAVVQDPRVRLGLTGRVPEYLGRISYSLYLVHGTVLFALLNLLYGRVSLVVVGALYAVVSWGLAHAFCVSVEEPSMRLGKVVGKRLRSGAPEGVVAGR